MLPTSRFNLDLSHGVSLIEIVIVIAIIAAVTLFSPFFTHHFFKRNQNTTTLNRLLAMLNFARLEAIKQNELITVCGTRDYQHCTDNWRDGQMIKNKNQIIRVFKALPPGDKLVWQSSGKRRSIIQFSPSGFTGQLGSFFFTPYGKNHYTHQIIVTLKGTIHVKCNNEFSY